MDDERPTLRTTSEPGGIGDFKRALSDVDLVQISRMSEQTISDGLANGERIFTFADGLIQVETLDGVNFVVDAPGFEAEHCAGVAQVGGLMMQIAREHGIDPASIGSPSHDLSL